jgi:hypothetical protein
MYAQCAAVADQYVRYPSSRYWLLLQQYDTADRTMATTAHLAA